MGLVDVVSNVKVGRVTGGALKLLMVYFLIYAGMILAAAAHGAIVAALRLLGVETVGFSEIMFNANRLLLVFLLLPLGIIIIGILILNIFFPFIATFIVDLLNNIFKGLGWDFTPLVSVDSSGTVVAVSLDATQLINFYFGLVNAMANVLLNLSLFQ